MPIKLNVLLPIAAVYMALLALGFIFIPVAMGIGAVPADASAALVGYLRVFGSAFAGIAVLNWLARDSEPSAARDAIVMSNIIGFGLATLLDLWGALGGGRPLQWVFAVIHVLFTIAFIWTRQAGSSAKTA